MMTPSVYKLLTSEGFEWLLPVNDADFEVLTFEGQPRSNLWRPVKMKRLKIDRRRPLKASDFPSCSGGDMFILSQVAKDKIGSYLEQYGELLPLACDDGDFWTLNVTRLVDALDESSSQLLRGSDTGEILMIHKHVFRPSGLEQAQLFKLPQVLRGLIYVTDPFVDMIKASGLKGLEFVKVWSPD